jgi:hypothetical protein
MKKAPTATNESGAFKSQHRVMQDCVELSANAQGCQTPAANDLALQGPTNDEFLQVMFGADWRRACVCSHTEPPDAPDREKNPGVWTGGPVHQADGLYQQTHRQNYTCVSTFSTDERGVYRRRQEQFAALHFIVLDDIGKKITIDPRTLGLGEPTLINETSPGNQQWFYRLREPIRDYARANYLAKEVLAMPVQGQLLTDQGARGLTRLCKLPVGMNLKLALQQPWRNRVLSWRPELAYDAQEVASWFGADLVKARAPRAPQAASASDAAEHSLIQALQAEGLLKSSQVKATGWWDIYCPQLDEHTGGDDSGTAVKVNANGSWTFKCQHGHCADFKAKDLFRFLENSGHELTPPRFRTDVRRLVNPALLDFSAFGVIEEEDDDENPEEDAAQGHDEGEEHPEPVEAEAHERPEAPADAGGGGQAGVPAGPGGPGGTSGGGSKKPQIYLDPGWLHRAVGQCAAILNEVVFKRGPHVVRIGRAFELSDNLQRSSMQPVVLGVTKPWLVRELTERATFNRYDKRMDDYRVVDCPVNIASTLETGTDDDTFRPLTAMANTPILRADGRICTTPGYDDETGIYYAPNLDFPPIPERPTWQDARTAIEELLALVKEFPFANDGSKSVFLADVLTALARPTLPKAPAVLYCATMAGTGKTLMASIANLIAYGHATLHPWPHGNEEELKKVFTSILLAGDPVVVFDNLPNGAVIKSAALSQFVTSDDYADRKLGESERVRFKNRTRVVLTGNNITLASDNARRALVCDLQLQHESARDREDDFELPDLVGYIKANRARLIVAGLTILRAYAVQPQQLCIKPLESFEDWSWRVRDALIWLGEEDPVVAVQFDNDGTGELAEAFQQIAAVAKARARGGQEPHFRSSELVHWATTHAELRDALQEAGCSEPSSTTSVGYWLRSLKNRIAGGLRLESFRPSATRAIAMWRVVSPVADRLAAQKSGQSER